MKVLVVIGLAVVSLIGCSAGGSSRMDSVWPPTDGRHCLQHIRDHLSPDGNPVPSRLAVRDGDYTTAQRTMPVYLCFWSNGSRPARVEFGETGPVRLVGPLSRTIPVRSAGDVLVKLSVRLTGVGTGQLLAREAYRLHRGSLSVFWQHALSFRVTTHQVRAREDAPLRAAFTSPDR